MKEIVEETWFWDYRAAHEDASRKNKASGYSESTITHDVDERGEKIFIVTAVKKGPPSVGA
jgi:hypothetical protein